MSQQDFRYLLDTVKYPNITSPYTIRGEQLPTSPSRLGGMINKFLKNHSVDFSDVYINAESLVQMYPTLIETNGECLGKVIILKWFDKAEVDQIDEPIRELWIAWKLAKANRGMVHESMNHLSKHKEEHLMYVKQLLKQLDFQSMEDNETIGKHVRENVWPVLDKLKQWFEETKLALPEAQQKQLED